MKTMPLTRFTANTRAICYGCDAAWHGPAGPRQARDHAFATGHHVEVETAVTVNYNPFSLSPEVEAAVRRARELVRVRL
ncbi:hypothetical protein XM25_19835 [Devosia sp. H5989]|nr:hypothetical protein XM25_19835 [Devosia sp. H5989]